jgi:hypothetical protein
MPIRDRPAPASKKSHATSSMEAREETKEKKKEND